MLEKYLELLQRMLKQLLNISDEGFITLFSELVRTGRAWSLQGFYGRTAAALIDAGVLDKKGNIL